MEGKTIKKTSNDYYSSKWEELDREERSVLYSMSAWCGYTNTVNRIRKDLGYNPAVVKYIIKRLMDYGLIIIYKRNDCKFPKYEYHPFFLRWAKSEMKKKREAEREDGNK